MPVTSVLKIESENEAEFHVHKIKDSLFLEESRTYERVRIYLEVTKGEISGIRLIMQGRLVRFLKDCSELISASSSKEKDFMRCDVEDWHTPVKVKGASEEYNDKDTEIALRFMKSVGGGKYLVIFDLESDAYEKTKTLMFFVRGLRWVYESRFFYDPTKPEDNELIVDCKRIETWIVPPYGGILWHNEPDKNNRRYTGLTEEAVKELQETYKIPDPGPVGRIAFQWEQERERGKTHPSMISKVECSLAMGSPLILTLSASGFIGFVVSVVLLLS